jgi:O-acetyl-ADP-ribose deacetylase (regulator of RNase III)
MNNLSYLIGDATAPTSAGNRIIAHICNDIGGWGRGFVLAISKRWPQPEAVYREWYRNRDHNDFALGAVQFVQVEADIWVANMIGQHEIARKSDIPSDGKPPIRYEAVETALAKVAVEAGRLKAAVHMPRIGCGLAGGKWEEIEPIIQRTLCSKNVEAYVYDLSRSL